MDHFKAGAPFDTDPAELELGRALGAPVDACDRETRLYARYVRALALLCECAPYVDDESYAERIKEVLADASWNYPLEWRRSATGIELSPRSADGEPPVAPALCGS
jgi:hypothetical protein